MCTRMYILLYRFNYNNNSFNQGQYEHIETMEMFLFYEFMGAHMQKSMGISCVTGTNTHTFCLNKIHNKKGIYFVLDNFP